MRWFYKSLVLLLFVVGFNALNAVDSKSMDLYLLIGQSNMAGRGKVSDEDIEKVPHVWTLNRANEWVAAQDPIHFDKKVAGVGPGRSFGIQMARQSRSVDIGLIPCAVGGTSIRTWKPGGYDKKTKTHPYDDMLVRLKIAMQHGEIKGILWHQGEADGNMGERGTYEAALVELIERVRIECGNPNVPFVIGQLGRFEERPWSEGRMKVDQAHQAVASKLPKVGFVSSEGLVDKGDLTHFGAESARELGKRFAKEMVDLQN